MRQAGLVHFAAGGVCPIAHPLAAFQPPHPDPVAGSVEKHDVHLGSAPVDQYVGEAGLDQDHHYAEAPLGQRTARSQRANYGTGIVATLSQQLVVDYDRGFEEKNLRRMLQCAEIDPDEKLSHH